jgi:hypothetical protein
MGRVGENGTLGGDGHAEGTRTDKSVRNRKGRIVTREEQESIEQSPG